MRRTCAIVSFAVVAFLWMMVSTPMQAQQPPDNVEGNWTIYSTNIENGETVVKHIQIAQYGSRITGSFEGPNQSGPIQGQINGHHIHFSTVTRNVLNFWGQAYGDNMSGTYGLHGKHAAWQAVRATSASSASPPTGTVYASQPILAPPEPPAPAPAPQPQYAAQPEYAAQPAPVSTAAPAIVSPAPTPAPLSAEQLDALVAPIALYPDALVAQVLAAATNPDQVSYADNWLVQNNNLTGTALEQAVNEQSWDPSVKALTQFPSVLDNLAHNLSWTSGLGQAFANQRADVMAAVQAMRARAQAAGTLQSNSQITVTQPATTTIVIQPANPQVVYVPQYNPAIVYGTPVVVPMYVPPPMPVASVGVFFGSGVTVGATFGGGWGGGWGWNAWRLNWGGWGGGGSTVIYNNNTYINNRTWNNTNYNGYHPWANGAAGSQNHAYYGANGTYHPVAGYKPGEDTHYGPNGAYHPNGYYGPDGGWHEEKPGTNPADQPNGDNNGNHGLIGGNGGVQNPSAGQTQSGLGAKPNSGSRGAQRSAQPNNRGSQTLSAQSHSRFSGDGAANRAESNRGRSSMAHRPPQHMAREQHAPAEHHSGGGGGGRRR